MVLLITCCVQFESKCTKLGLALDLLSYQSRVDLFRQAVVRVFQLWFILLESSFAQRPRSTLELGDLPSSSLNSFSQLSPSFRSTSEEATAWPTRLSQEELSPTRSAATSRQTRAASASLSASPPTLVPSQLPSEPRPVSPTLRCSLGVLLGPQVEPRQGSTLDTMDLILALALALVSRTTDTGEEEITCLSTLVKDC